MQVGAINKKLCPILKLLVWYTGSGMTENIHEKDPVNIKHIEIADLDRITGELSAKDLDILRRIDADPARVFWFESEPENYIPLTDEQLKEFAGDVNDHLLFIVRGSGMLQGVEPGEIQGWVKVNPDAPSRIKQMADQNILTDTKTSLVLEVSYAAISDAPSHQMSSALRQLCYDYGSAFNQFDHPEFDVFITAYVQDKVDSATGRPNIPSMRVLQTCGFEERGKVQYDELAETPDHLFVLNWSKLEENIKTRVGVNF